jgi:hypothetical protein
VNIFSNVDFQSISESELELFEKSIKNDEEYLFYLTIYIRIKNGFNINEDRYKEIKWFNEYFDYCKIKQTNTISYSFYMDDVIINSTCGEVRLNV